MGKILSTLAKGLQDLRYGFSVASRRKMAIKARKNLHAGVFLPLHKGKKFKGFSGRNDEAITRWQNNTFKSMNKEYDYSPIVDPSILNYFIITS